MRSKTAFYRLVRTGYLELIREPKSFFFIMIFPLIFLLMFGLMGYAIPPSESMHLSFFEFMFPGILILALLTVGLFGTTTPLIQMRKNGTLRLFQITPLKKETFLVSQLAVRFILAFIQIALFLLIGAIVGVVKIHTLLPLFLASLLGMALILTIGFLLGGVLNSVELAGGILGGLSAPVLMLSGVLLPLTIFPKTFEKVAMFFPFTYLGDLIRTILFDHFNSMFSIYTNILVLVGFTLLFFVLARVTFKWEQS